MMFRCYVRIVDGNFVGQKLIFVEAKSKYDVKLKVKKFYGNNLLGIETQSIRKVGDKAIEQYKRFGLDFIS